MTGARDSQKAKLYRAEWEVFKPTWKPLDITARRIKLHLVCQPVPTSAYVPVYYPTVPECESYVAKVWGSLWTRKHFARARYGPAPRIKDGRGTRIARGSARLLNLPLWARTDWTILHEIAHALTIERPAHGWEYARNYLALVQHFLGGGVANELKAAFRKHHVRFAAKKVLTPERLEALRAHGRALAAARWNHD